MLVLAGCIMLVAAGTGAGFYKADKLKDQADYLRDILNMTEKIKIYVASDYMTSEEIFQRLADDESLCVLQFLHCGFSRDITDDLRESVSSDGCEYLLCIKNKLMEYLGSFGKTDMQGQLARTETLRRDAEELWRFHQDRYNKYARLYRVIGFLGGLLAAVVLI